MRVLVTGCAGFIGSKVAQLLSRSGHIVIGLDNLNDAYDTRLKDWRLAQLAESPGFTFHLGDITEKSVLTPLFSEGTPDAVINLAARAGVRQSVEDPWTYYQTNVDGTLNLLDMCRQFGVKKFVLSSTSSVYGDGDGPYTEDSPSDRTISPYAASKKAAEVACYTYHRLHDLDVSVLRYFTVYGPAGRPDMSVFRFIRLIAESQPIVVYGDGSQQRDFTYVEDIARGTVAALMPTGFEIFNLGSDRPIVLLDVIRQIEDGLGLKAEIENLPRHLADVPATWADITKARQVLGWAPEVSFETGVCNAIEWYRQNRDWAKDLN